MKRAVITGATGAIGTALVKELINNGVEVLVITREGSNRNNNIPERPLVEKCYCDLAELESLKNNTGKEYDVFYHFAWTGTTGQARNDMYLQNQNVKYALDAVGAAKRFGCHTFVGAGSQAEFGRFEGKLTAKTPVFPEMGYGYAKLCAGLMTRDHAHQLGMKHVWTRILSVYGPNDGPQSLISSVISKVSQGIAPDTTKGEQMWDYLYSGDAARAFRMIGESGKDGRTYILGSGSVRPLADYIRDIRDVIDPECEINFGAIAYGPNQVMYLCADTTELTEDTGWKPEVVFVEGIKSIIS